MRSRVHRSIWEAAYGPIPVDKDGRSYEIHHVDGDRTNNSLENLKCVTIQEHYDIHYAQGDLKACHIISKRMTVPPNLSFELASRAMKGRIWITDGTKDRSVYPDQIIPENWYRGRTGGKNFGPRSEEFCKKMSDIKRGKPLSDEHKKSLVGIKRGMSGKSHSEETKKKMSLASKGKPKTEAHKKALSEAKRNKK